jgi:hypothetical protein
MAWIIFLIIGFWVIGAISNSAEESKKQAEALKEAKRRQKEAEDYIWASGDPQAIKMLMLARANPSHYGQLMAGGVEKGNSTLKTAMGVMAGVAVGNLVANAATAAVLSEALAKVPTEVFSSSLDAVGSVADLTDIDFTDLL